MLLGGMFKNDIYAQGISAHMQYRHKSIHQLHQSLVSFTSILPLNDRSTGTNSNISKSRDIIIGVYVVIFGLGMENVRAMNTQD